MIQTVRSSLAGVLLSLVLTALSFSSRSDAALVHRYSFTSDASDAAGAAHGTLQGGATLSGGAVVLNGSTAFVDLPNGLVSTLTDATFETWLTDNGSGNWSRIFDFGFSTGGEGSSGTGTNYIFLCPQSGSGTLRGGILVNSLGGEQMVDWAGTRLPVGSLKHVVWTLDASAHVARLYVDGAPVGENAAMTFNPSQLGYTLNNWLGRSQWSGDAYFYGSITEFRIYDTALTAEEVEQNFAWGPEVAANGPVTVVTHPQSQAVVETRPVTFSVGYGGTPPVRVQWFRNGSAIPGATNDAYTIPVAGLTNNGAIFRAGLTNTHNGTTYSATSGNAMLTVTVDTDPPVLVRAASLYPGEVLVTFSEGLLPSTATNVTNYAITHAGGALAVTGARFGATGSNIVLTTAAQTLGTTYTLTVNHVRDLAAAANLIATNSQATFVASLYVSADIGDPASAGTLTPVADGYDLTSGGAGLGGGSDQFTFGYRSLTNDFDVAVRVDALEFSGAWARAGLMARDGVGADAPFAGSFATPGPAGCHFMSRASDGADAAMAGSFPVSYPDTWLRLRRTGNVFDGFASLDGQTWECLGSATIAMSPDVLVGFVLTAGSADRTTSARFRDDGAGGGVIVTNAPLPFEPLGPSSRRTPLAISEIMYNPPGAWEGTNNLEYIEIWNSGLVTEDLSGHRLSGEIAYQFPDGTTIAPGQFLVVAKEPAAAQGFYGVACLGPYTNKLSNSGGALRLRNELGGILLEVEYDNKLPWPVAADGAGHSLALSRPSYGENDPRAWSASDAIGGSPGAFEPYGAEPARGVVINEFLAHTDDPVQDYIELFNTGAQAVNLSGAWLSDEPGTHKFRIPDGTVLAGRGRAAWNQTQLGFQLSADGERIFLVNSNRTRVLDAVSFEGQANGVSFGRYPDGAPGFQELSTLSQGTGNAPPLVRPLVINEIMYHPISESEEDEYIEIHNRGASAVDIGGWKLRGGVAYTFPSNTVIHAGGYIVVAGNRTNLLAKYAQLNLTNTFGNYEGALKDSGERIALTMPEDLVNTNAQGAVVTNFYDIVVDEVTYGDGGRWGRWSDGGGSSLELADPDSDNRQAASWTDSDESAKAAWTTIEVTDILENGQSAALVNEGGTGYGVANRFEFFLQGPGEALVDDLAFLSNGGSSLVANGNFESGLTGWTLGGVLRGSYAEGGVGVGGSQALHLVSVDRGDTGPNKVCRALSATAATGAPNTGTIRASVRWLKGSPYVLFRLRGNWMEVSRRLNVPSNCGTPGLPNSRLVANAGPALADVSHAPALPAAGQAVVVSARPVDPDGLGAVTLRYRLDPATGYAALTMLDNGTGGDAQAGDGVYSATLAGRPAGTMAAFYVSALDALSASNAFPSGVPVRECHVRWGEAPVAGGIGTYRLWVTASNIAFWTSREKNANDPVDATFVYGRDRVIYNVDTLYSGSPFHVPSYDGPLGTMPPDYEVNFPPDDRFLGSGPFVLTAYDVVNSGWFYNDDSGQVDLTGNWIARKLGQQYNHRRHVHVFMNGVRRGTIYDDAQQPNGEMLDEYFPDDTGRRLRKIESWFEFADNAQDQGSTYATIARVNKSTGALDAKRYRWNWRPRATDDPDDWSALTNLIAVVNDTAAPDYEARVRTWMDVPRFLRPVATHHICGSWDSYAYSRGKNMYAYQPDGQPWRLLMWDIEIALGAGGDGPTQSIYTMFDSTLLSLITSVPAFHREYLAAFQEAVDTTLAAGAADALLEERYASFRQNGVPMISPQFITAWIAQRRAYLLTILPAAAFTVANAPYQVVSGSNTVTLAGSAPLSVGTLLVNSNAYPVTWTSVTNWSVLVPLAAGTNVLSLSALDRDGHAIAGATGTVTVHYTGADVAPEDCVVFNEIMYQPAVAGAAFIEIFNAHTNRTFDLSNWRVNGLGYVFPPGSILPPRRYLVLAEDAFAFTQTYGLTHLVFGEYPGSLDPDGETLTLFRPGAGTNEIVVDRVRYEASAPWAPAAGGASLQLADAAQDNSRVANWRTQASVTNITAATPQWVYVTKTATLNANASRFYLYLGSAGEIYIDDVMLVAGSTPGSGANLLANGNFESALSGTWTISADFAGSALSTAEKHGGNSSLRMVATAPGSGYGDSIQQTLSSTLPWGGTYSLSFWYLQNSVGAPFIARLNSSSPSAGIYVSLDPVLPSGNTTNIIPGCTPGTANSVATNLPPFPPVWLNELQADNVTGPLDNYGQRDPWTELYHSAGTNFSLAGYYLSDTYTNLTKWAFPANASVPAGGFTVAWCDNETHQAAAASIHAGFRLASGGGHLALSRLVSNAVQIVDYLNYTNLAANWSYGDIPDGQPFYRDAMFYPTPGGTNNGASPPITIFINEWMADNTCTLMDPSDNDYEDWFELYNPGTNAVDLGGYYLTDDLGDPFGFEIPDNGHYTVPAGGYLLVWADNEIDQNSTNRTDLHVDFALSKQGDAIGLFAADGTMMDAVSFGAQPGDVSQGRFPDGAPAVYPMGAPTPRAGNVLSNSAPTLAAIGDRVLTLGQTLSFTAAASDDDQPPQTLTFSLSGAPAGASIGYYSGLFSWTPAAAGTQTMSVVVSDDGTPSLSATQPFTVAVVPPPVLGNLALGGGRITFSWPTAQGQGYRVEYKDDLMDALWFVPPDGAYTGTGAPLSFTNWLDEDTVRRFFRIRLVP